jgi:hypothetical protein
VALGLREPGGRAALGGDRRGGAGWGGRRVHESATTTSAPTAARLARGKPRTSGAHGPTVLIVSLTPRERNVGAPEDVGALVLRPYDHHVAAMLAHGQM